MVLSTAAPRLLGRFAGATPVTLFRIQGGASVRLRLEAAQRAAGRSSFDISAHEGGAVVRPRAPAGAGEEERFLGPNGMSMRPKGAALAMIVAPFRAARALVFEVPAGTSLPPELCVLHEHSDHFSVQPAREMAPAQLNAALTAFLAQPGVVRMESKEAFYARHPDMHPNTVGFSSNA
jgi:hypothetical protein